jgi:hypothetical protein
MESNPYGLDRLLLEVTGSDDHQFLRIDVLFEGFLHIGNR